MINTTYLARHEVQKDEEAKVYHGPRKQMRNKWQTALMTSIDKNTNVK